MVNGTWTASPLTLASSSPLKPSGNVPGSEANLPDSLGRGDRSRTGLFSPVPDLDFHLARAWAHLAGAVRLIEVGDDSRVLVAFDFCRQP